MAAQATVGNPDLYVHSLHGYFILAGNPAIPILFEVERVRDGRSFATRMVRALQQMSDERTFNSQMGAQSLQLFVGGATHSASAGHESGGGADSVAPRVRRRHIFADDGKDELGGGRGGRGGGDDEDDDDDEEMGEADDEDVGGPGRPRFLVWIGIPVSHARQVVHLYAGAEFASVERRDRVSHDVAGLALDGHRAQFRFQA